LILSGLSKSKVAVNTYAHAATHASRYKCKAQALDAPTQLRSPVFGRVLGCWSRAWRLSRVGFRDPVPFEVPVLAALATP
jgi:hypothetical protein